MRFVPLNSSSLAGLAYNPDTEELVAHFNNDKYYKYQGVDSSTVLSILFDPDSQGKAFNAKIVKGSYPYKEIDGSAL